MKPVSRSSMFAVLFLGMFAASAHAQDVITVNVPFPFVVGSESFPAGRYQIEAAEFGSSVIEIRGMDKHATAGFALTSAVGGQDPAGDKPTIVFTKSENAYRLSQIWESRGDGREVAHR